MSGDPSETIAKEIKEYLQELKPETSSLKEDLSETCPVKETIATKEDFHINRMKRKGTEFLCKPYLSSANKGLSVGFPLHIYISAYSVIH